MLKLGNISSFPGRLLDGSAITRAYMLHHGKFFKRCFSAAQMRKQPATGQLHFYRRTDHPNLFDPLCPKGLDNDGDELRYAVSILPDLPRFRKLIPESIVGWSPFDEGGFTEGRRIWINRFIEQHQFVDFMHSMLPEWLGTVDRGLIARAHALQHGWIHICDERALPPFGRTPDPDDIIGSCFVKDGVLVPETYQRMPSHRLLSHLGPFQLSPAFFDKLVEELYKRLEKLA